ncbi:MAG: hypothetical protein AB7I25_10580 [Vicinamibacterales bacterium]
MTRQRRLVGIALVALAGGVLAVAAGRFFLEPAAQPDGGPAAAGAPAGAVPAVAVVDLQLGRLNQTLPAPVEGTRDPFRYSVTPAAPKPAVAPRRPMLGPPVPLPPPPPAPVPPPPPIPLKFMGLVEMAARGGKVAVLSDSRGGVFYGREGDIIDGRYRLLRVTADQAELAYADGRGRQALRLSGQ